MRCILCNSLFPDRTLQEILEDDASEYLCTPCYETDFEVLHNVPEGLTLREEVRETLKYFVDTTARSTVRLSDESLED